MKKHARTKTLILYLEKICLNFRGTMDASAFVSKEEWEEILLKNGCDEVSKKARGKTEGVLL